MPHPRTREAFRYLEGERWVSLTWLQTKDQAFRLAAGLLALGVERETRVAIVSGTRMEWILADLAITCAAGATTTVYPTTAHEDVAYILADSESSIVFAEDEVQVAKVLDHLGELPAVTTVVQMIGRVEHELVISWADLQQRGKDYLAIDPTAVENVIAGIEPQDLATLIYTSGTTGRPKGVRLLNDNWTYVGVAIEAYDLLRSDDLQYLWLPLSHAFGKVMIAAQLRIGFATAVDGRMDKIVENLGVVRPTFMAGPPRIFEKVRARVMTNAAHGVKAKIFGWAFGVGRKVSRLRLAGQEPTGRAQGPARARRQAGIQQDQGAHGRQHPVLRLRLGLAEPRGPGVVPCRRAAGAGGLRSHRDQRVHLPEQPPRHPFRNGRPAAARLGDQDRRRWRDHGQGSERDAGIPQGAGGSQVRPGRMVRHR